MTVYVVHYCKNERNPEVKCMAGWIDEDLTNARSRPPQWKYCPHCVDKGFVNPDKPPTSEKMLKLTASRIEKRLRGKAQEGP